MIRYESLLKILAGVLIAIVPATLSYCKAKEETALASREADAGYKVLVVSVAQLQQTVAAQQATITLLMQRLGAPPSTPVGVTFPDLPANTSAALRQQERPAD